MMKKRVFVMIAATLIMLALTPVASGQVFAAEPRSDAPLYVQGIEVTGDNNEDVLNDGGSVSYSFASDTLTLNNANIVVAGSDESDILSRAGIYRDGPLKLELIGSNTITNDTEKEEGFLVGVLAFGNEISISGEGSLAIDFKSNADDNPYVEAILCGSAVISSGLDITIDIPEASFAFGISTYSLEVNAPLSVNISANGTAAGLSVNGANVCEIVFNAPADIAVLGEGESAGISSSETTAVHYRDGSIEVNNSRVSIEARSGAGKTAVGILNLYKLNVNGDSELSVQAKHALRGVNTVDVDMGASLEAVGSGQAFVESYLGDNAKALGAMTKSSVDGEYSPCEDLGALDDDRIKGIRIPAREACHIKAQPATCKEDGHIEYWTLSDGADTAYYRGPKATEENLISNTDELVIPALGGEHQWDAGKVTKKATASEDGEIRYTCERCGSLKTERIPKEDYDGASKFYVPITVSGFNRDVVFDYGRSGDRAINLDTAVSCYYAGDGEEGSIPLNGVIGTDTGKYFKLADYESNNVLKLYVSSDGGNPGGTLGFSDDSKAKYSKIALLATGGDGEGVMTATVKFDADDAAEPVTQKAEFRVPDWYNGSDDLKVFDGGRCRYGDGVITSKGGFGLYEFVIDIDEAYRAYDITGIDIRATLSDSTIGVFAVSGVPAEKGYSTVIFDAGRGASDRAVDKVISGASITLPSASLRGCEFEGWYDGESKVGDAGDGYIVDSDAALKARWKENFIYCYTGYDSDKQKLVKLSEGGYEHPRRNNYEFKGFAAVPGGDAIAEDRLEPGKTYYAIWNNDNTLYVEGIEVTEENNEDVLEDGGSVSYDFDTNTLTLKNAKLSTKITDVGEYYKPLSAIYRDGPVKLKLIGSNTITNGSNSGKIIAICSEEDSLSISGSGSLAVNIDGSTAGSLGMADGIDAGFATISSKLDIDIDTSEVEDVYACGIEVEHNLVINAPVSVRAKAKEAAYGIIYESLDPVDAAINAETLIDVQGKRATGLLFRMENAKTDRLAVNNAVVRITSKADSDDAALGIADLKRLSVIGNSDVSVRAGRALSSVYSVDVDKSASLEAVGSGQAFISTNLKDNTRALGAMIKSSVDGEYSPWDGSSNLNTESIKGILIPPRNPSPVIDNNTANTASAVSINKKTVTAADVAAAVAGAGGPSVTEVVLGKKVKKIGKRAFAGTNVNTLVVTSKKLKKKSVKGSLKGSAVTKVRVKVGKAKTSKKYVKKYKKIFTKKNAGKKVKVKKY